MADAGPVTVDLWLTETATDRSPERRAAWESLLDEGELARYRRITHPRVRREFLASHAMARHALSALAPLPPDAWRFELGPRGRPELRSDQAAEHPISFNIAHAHGLAVCALCRGVDMDVEVGVDVEDVQRRSRTVAIADRFFAPAEVAALRALPAGAQRERFFAYWTLKEAYIKARGMGLAIPLERFAFDLDAGDTPVLTADPEIDPDPGAWCFLRLRPTARHPVAIALRAGGRAVEVALTRFP